MEQQPVGWEPDLNDGVRLNIRPFIEADVLRKKPNIKWGVDRGKNPPGSYWGEARDNDKHLSLEEKQIAREKIKKQKKKKRNKKVEKVKTHKRKEPWEAAIKKVDSCASLMEIMAWKDWLGKRVPNKTKKYHAKIPRTNWLKFPQLRK